MGRGDILDYPKYIDKLREIWTNREVVIIEGAMSRLGVGNDLFEGAKRIERIIAPVTNAYSRFDDLMTYVKKNVSKDKLILIALGHTATLLASELNKLDYQALDLGHIDVEYEWYRMQAKGKVPIPHKYVNEVKEGRVVELDENPILKQYKNEIIARIS